LSYTCIILSSLHITAIFTLSLLTPLYVTDGLLPLGKPFKNGKQEENEGLKGLQETKKTACTYPSACILLSSNWFYFCEITK
jgi:hypothetical protein